VHPLGVFTALDDAVVRGRRHEQTDGDEHPQASHKRQPLRFGRQTFEARQKTAWNWNPSSTCAPRISMRVSLSAFSKSR
jgi:hypothetical protein